MEVILTNAEETTWQCQISLRIIYDKNGKREPEPAVVPMGSLLSDPNEVEARLRSAQNTILKLPFAKGDVDKLVEEEISGEAKVVGFSKNVVRLDVSGPGLVDVTFIDLPGIITNSNQAATHGLCD